MPTTLRNTDILFNDGSTQSTAALSLPATTAGNIAPGVGYSVAVSMSGASYVLSSNVFWIRRGGVIRIRLSLSPGASGYTNDRSWGRIFINGAAVGTELTTNAGNVSSNQDFSVNPGDRIAVGVRTINQFWTAGATMWAGIGDVSQNLNVVLQFNNF